MGHSVSRPADILPLSSLERDRVRLGEGHLGLGCPCKRSSAQGECGRPRGHSWA